MSASTWIERAKGRIDLRRSMEAMVPGDWIGVDISDENAPRHVRRLIPLLVIALIAALGVAALRIDLIRIRYAMASTLAKEEASIAEQRRLIVRRLQLRDPVELAVQARARGFRAPTRILSLPEPVIADSLFAEAVSNLPSVAAGPPVSETRNDWQ